MSANSEDAIIQRLTDLAERMERIPRYPSESGHQDADDLLIEALRQVVTTVFPQGPAGDAVERLISSYDNIGKWWG